MIDQISIDEIIEIEQPSPFEIGDIDNESEDDLDNKGMDSIGEMAISGTDWTTETIVKQIEKGNIILDPDFQRRDAWGIKKKSRFIESLILGFPIPQIILAEMKGKKGKFIVIDGKQRLLSIYQFMSSKTIESKKPLKLSGLEVKKNLNGLTYKKMLDEHCDNDIDALCNQPIRTVVVKNWPSVEVLYLIFLRLNTASVKLSPQELRQALYPGKFISYANKAASESKGIKRILHLTSNSVDFRMRDVEIYIRYMAFQLNTSQYHGSMQRFLDDTCDMLNKTWRENENTVISKTNTLEKAIQCVYTIFGNDSFSKYKGKKYEGKMNRAIMDIMLYYFSDDTIRERALEKPESIKELFQDLCTKNTTFLDSIEQTTKSMWSIKYRFGIWAFWLGSCLLEDIKSPYGDVV